jgi:hypothetical protein
MREATETQEKKKLIPVETETRFRRRRRRASLSLSLLSLLLANEFDSSLSPDIERHPTSDLILFFLFDQLSA